MLNDKNQQTRIVHPARLSFRIEGEIKNISDKQKPKKFINTKPMQEEVLKDLLQVEKKRLQ